MKKVLVGCGVLLLLGMVGMGVGVWWLGKTVNSVAGDLFTATQTATKMSLDRMEQEAVAVAAEELGPHIVEHTGKPVRVTGKFVRMTDAAGNAPPGMDENSALFLEPAVVVMTQFPDVLPARRTEGMVLEVLGVAARLNLAALPGVDEKAVKEMREKLGGTELPVVVARKVRVVSDSPPPAQPPAKAP